MFFVITMPLSPSIVSLSHKKAPKESNQHVRSLQKNTEGIFVVTS